jgi:ABC-type spermidine/putrescine transport system permease subunit I
MTEAQDTIDRKAKRMRRIRWGLAWGLGLAAAACWSVLVGAVGFVCLPIMLFFQSESTAGFTTPEYYALTNDIGFGAAALALAPWVIVSIVFGVLGVRWWRSRASEAPEDTEQYAA